MEISKNIKIKSNFIYWLQNLTLDVLQNIFIQKLIHFPNLEFNPPKQKLFEAKYLKNLGNDLEKVALNKYPELKRIKSYLSGLPNALFARMSGSGSSIVAYFHSKKACKKAYRQYKRKFNSHWCIESKTI